MSTQTKVTKEEQQLRDARERLSELATIQTAARDEELAIREWVAGKYATKEDGATTTTVGATKFTVTCKLNRSITKEEAERLTQDHGALADEVLRWKPEVRGGEIKKHPELEEYIVTKAGPPTITFK